VSPEEIKALLDSVTAVEEIEPRVITGPVEYRWTDPVEGDMPQDPGMPGAAGDLMGDGVRPAADVDALSLAEALPEPQAPDEPPPPEPDAAPGGGGGGRLAMDDEQISALLDSVSPAASVPVDTSSPRLSEEDIAALLDSVEVKPDPLKKIFDAARRGWALGQGALALESGDAAGVAEAQRRAAEFPASEDFKRMWDEAEAPERSWAAFVKDPVGNLGELFAESMAQQVRAQLPKLGLVPQYAMAGGIGGGLAGMAGGPASPLTATAGFAKGLQLGAQAGYAHSAGLASYAVDLSSEVIGALEAEGVNVRDPEQMRRAMEDTEKMRRLKERGAKHAVPVAAFDLTSAVIGGNLFSKPAKKVLPKIGQWATELAVQGLFGGAGEASGQAIQEGRISSPKAILAEVVGEGVGGVADVAAGKSAQALGKAVETGGRVVKKAASAKESKRAEARADRALRMMGVDLSKLPGATAQEKFEALLAERDGKVPPPLPTDPESFAPPAADQPPAEAPPSEAPVEESAIEDPFALDPEEDPDAAERAAYEAEMREAMGDALESAGSSEMLAAIEDAGGLPTLKSDQAEGFRGELRNIWEAASRAERLRIFRKDSHHPDRLRESLNSHGFSFETPMEMLESIEARLRSGREVWSEPQKQDDYWSERMGMAEPEGVDLSDPAAAKAFLESMVPEPMPDRPKIRTLKEGWEFFRDHIMTLQLTLPDGSPVSWTPQHFIKLIVGNNKRKDKEKPKGFVFGHDSSSTIMDDLARGELDYKDINGFEQDRLAHLHLIPNILDSGAILYLPEKHLYNYVKAFKTADGRTVFLSGFVAKGGQPTGPTTFHPKNLTAGWLKGALLVKPPGGLVNGRTDPADGTYLGEGVGSPSAKIGSNIDQKSQTVNRADDAARNLGRRPVVSARDVLDARGRLTPAERRAARRAQLQQERIVALAWNRKLLPEGRIDWSDLEVTSALELRLAAEAVRNPAFETVWFVGTRDGKVVDIYGVTSKHPRSVRTVLPGQTAREMMRRLKRAGADSAWMLHNHPSGDPSPGKNDLTATRYFAEAAKASGVTMKGHLVINGKRYASIAPDGSHTMEEIPGATDRDALLEPEYDHELLGAELTGPRAAEAVASRWAQIAARNKTGDGMVTLFFTSGRRKVRAVVQVPVGLFTDRRRFPAYLRSRASRYGVTHAYSFYDGARGFSEVGDAAVQYSEAGILDDGFMVRPNEPPRPLLGRDQPVSLHFGKPAEAERSFMVSEPDPGGTKALVDGEGPRSTSRMPEDKRAALFPESNRLSNINPIGAVWSRIKSENPGVHPNSEWVTIYRATVGDAIRPNDFVALNKSVAENHLSNLKDRGEQGKIVSSKVRLGDLLMANDATEFIYYPTSSSPDTPAPGVGAEATPSAISEPEPGSTDAGVMSGDAVEAGPVMLVSQDGRSEFARVRLRGLEDIKVAEMPELLEMVRRLGADVKLRRMRSAMGQFVPEGEGVIRLDPRIWTDRETAAKVLMHEFGHLADWLPDHTLGRGNILGRLLSLRRHLHATAYGATTGTAESKVRKELEALTRWWRPWDADKSPAWYNKYRDSSSELYADAISVLFNSPADLKAIAPTFYREFFKYLDRKPDVQRAFFELQALVHRPIMEVLESRQGRTRAGYRRAEERWLAAREAARQPRFTPLRLWHMLHDQLMDKAGPWTRRQAAAERAGVEVPEGFDMRIILDELPMADNLTYRWLTRMDERVTRPLEAAGLSLDDMGEYLQHKRIMAERQNMANPDGHTEDTSRAALLNLRLQLGDQKFALLERAAADFHEMVFEVVSEATDEGLISRETFDQVIVPNKDSYAAFRPIEHVEDYVPAGVHRMEGTLSPIENPGLTTIQKVISMRRAIQWNKARRAGVGFMREFCPEEVSEASRKPDGTFHKPSSKDRTLLEYRADGKTHAIEVPQEMTLFFERMDPARIHAAVHALNFVFRRGFYNMWVRYNPAFQLLMGPLRDAKRYYVNMPRAGAFRLAKEYLAAMPAAARRLRGSADPIIRDMYDNLALSTPHDSFARTASRDDAYADLLRQFHVLPEDQRGTWRDHTLLRPVAASLRGIEFIGQIFEATPKIAAYKILVEDGADRRQAARYVRNYVGVPNYTRKGSAAYSTGAVLPFWNVAVQGLRADTTLMLGKERMRSRAGWWFKWAVAGGAYAILSALARSGALGDELEDLFGGASDYDFTNNMVIPLGRIPGKEHGHKILFLRLPEDEHHRMINGMLKRVISLSSKAIKGDPNISVPDELLGLLDYASGQLPGLNPALGMAAKWGDYMGGNNPWDPFRGRHVLTPDQQKVRGIAALGPMFSMMVDSSGISSIYRYNPESDTTTEAVINSLPVFQRVLKVSDAGYKGAQWEAATSDDIDRARARLGLPASAQRLRKEMAGLRRLGEDHRNPAQQDRYEVLREWESRIYKPAMDDALSAQSLGRDPSPILRSIDAISRSYED